MEQHRKAKVCTTISIIGIALFVIVLLSAPLFAAPQLNYRYVETFRGFVIYQTANLYLALSPHNHQYTAYTNLTLLEMDIATEEQEFNLK